MKHKKHDRVVNDFEAEKRKKLKYLADEMYKQVTNSDKLKELPPISNMKNIFNLFKDK